MLKLQMDETDSDGDESKEDKAAPVTTPPAGLLAILVQDLSAAFFSHEVLHGERALGDARARLGALWDKLMELTEERDKVMLASKVEAEGPERVENTGFLNVAGISRWKQTCMSEYILPEGVVMLDKA